MKRHSNHHVARHPGKELTEEAQALLSATAHVAGDKVEEARERLAAAMQKGRDTWNGLSHKAAAGAKATDQAIRTNPYKAAGIALGVGALIGFLLGRRNR